MPKSAVMFGAGNIGRGFIAQLFCESGYHVTFVDIDRELIDALNKQGSYRLQTVYNEDVQTFEIGPVSAVHSEDVDAVAAAVAKADIGATAVGAGALKFIAAPLAAGLQKRQKKDNAELNLIICENLKGASDVFRGLIRQELPDHLHAYLNRDIGLVDTVIGRMVPNPTPDMRAQDITLIRVEPYKELPVNRATFVGDIPEIMAMMPEDNFDVYTARKLYIHNCGHALLAYCGFLAGMQYGYQALENADVRAMVNAGLDESIRGIVAAYGVQAYWLRQHVDDLMHRFANRALGDTIFRLGRDPIRKLAAQDRLAGAANLVCAAGELPSALARGIAAGYCFDPAEDLSAQKLQRQIASDGIAATIKSVSGIEPDSDLGLEIQKHYNRLRC